MILRLTLFVLALIHLAESFSVPLKYTSISTTTRYKLSDDERQESHDSAPLSVDFSVFDTKLGARTRPSIASLRDPSQVEIVSTQALEEEKASELEQFKNAQRLNGLENAYPVAAMMECSAPYIASHHGKICVVHLPGDLLDSKEINSILSDLALSWLLGMKLVIVVGCRFNVDNCDFDLMKNAHECHNALRITDRNTLRQFQEEAGFIRTEVERKLNRFLRHHNGSQNEGNIVSGNFYSAQRFGRVHDEDFQYNGYTAEVHEQRIKQVMHDNDIVLLTTVGTTPYGELVDVNGYHLAASVAASLGAHKLVYMANEGSFLQKKNGLPLQEVPLSFVNDLVEHNHVKIFNTGFASFENARQNLSSSAVELLLHLGWSAWALERGVTRAHVINPTDGAILEELFTSKNGLNTCIYHDDENQRPRRNGEMQNELDEFLSETSSVPETVARKRLMQT
ncbi:hypothetical protein FisN_8Hh271 [Fistulifera solaris]|jgi:acetylglutamate kinase|uniref:Aspartate/glutamate/uridylate kinase domain-containing protein n=1 Tax=Fistulifera solaris TaxID=1519565 RepID=A0A1Z5JYE9_FISSO|nr:hypothetical protein FisN_8Hh271 [Fistulifera solaris]|eukprot:GAX19047.1 hypothetical protein FisN_8Hh271 [Fistulifera solaris]